MFNHGFYVLIQRETIRFLKLWKQTIMPGFISSGLYILVFGHALGSSNWRNKRYILYELYHPRISNDVRN